MESLEAEVIAELKALISYSCSMNERIKFQDFHVHLIKYCFKAVDVRIDYQAHRVHMNIIADDKEYSPQKVNTVLTLIPANFYYLSLADFLKASIITTGHYLLPYATLISKFRPQSAPLVY
ncbi:hypothetical protein [Spongiimicrobium salis]|uniref:hypothetical protein n=1 Tax=Spongiimicrobium salis TaxID=1667022 RepID=UPI00374D652A